MNVKNNWRNPSDRTNESIRRVRKGAVYKELLSSVPVLEQNDGEPSLPSEGSLLGLEAQLGSSEGQVQH